VTERLLLDTDVAVEYLRDRPDAVAWLDAQEGKLLLSVITVAELFAGLRGEEERRRMENFLLAFELAPVTPEIARAGGGYRREYRPSHGTGLADALIAATADARDAVLVTFNAKHFPMLEEVRAPYPRKG
jgi:predicted nucleic acid-binding protein